MQQLFHLIWPPEKRRVPPDKSCEGAQPSPLIRSQEQHEPKSPENSSSHSSSTQPRLQTTLSSWSRCGCVAFVLTVEAAFGLPLDLGVKWVLLFPAVCQASSVWRDPRQAEGEGCGGREKEETKWRVCQKCGWKGRWLTTAARAAAPIPLGLPHCSTLSLEDASVVTVENEKIKKA